MYDYWHIPRATIVAQPSVTSSSTIWRKEYQQGLQTLTLPPPTHNTTVQPEHYHQQNKQRGSKVTHTKMDGKINRNQTAMNATKRGSRLSQSSNYSNNSTRSATSGSLLLTAANLERFEAIYQKPENLLDNHYNSPLRLYMPPRSDVYITALNHPPEQQITSTTFDSKLMQVMRVYDDQVVAERELHRPEQWTHYPIENEQQQERKPQLGATIVNIDHNLHFNKAKDLDAASIASSMHFTMINGETGTNKKPHKGLCDRGRQVTVLITSMSILFLILIMSMVYALEMRAREMPQS